MVLLFILKVFKYFALIYVKEFCKCPIVYSLPVLLILPFLHISYIFSLPLSLSLTPFVCVSVSVCPLCLSLLSVSPQSLSLSSYM